MKTLAACLAVVALTGCASNKEFLQTQLDAQKMASEHQKPLVEITAQPGQQITSLSGIKVYMPNQQPQIRQATNEWAAVVSQGLGVVGTLGGIKFAGDAAVGLSNSIGKYNSEISGRVQAPGVVTTNTMTSSTGVLGSGTYGLDSTHTPTVVTQPTPVIVTQPESVIVTTPDPIIVTQPAPVVVQ